MLSDFFTFDTSDITSVIVGILLAVFAEPVYCWVMNKVDGKAREIPKPTAKQVMYALLAIAFIWTLYSTNETQRAITQVQARELECYAEFNDVIKLRGDANTSDLDLIDSKIDAGSLWLNTLLNPPPEIAALPDQAPERKQYGLGKTGDYLNELKRIRLEQIRNDEIRRLNPLPEANCGKQ